MRHHAVPAPKGVLHVAPDVVLRRGLHVPHVAAVARELPALERLRDRVLVADRAARGVDDPGALLEVLEQLGVAEAARALVQGAVDGDDVALGDEVLQVLDTASSNLLGGVCSMS